MTSIPLISVSVNSPSDLFKAGSRGYCSPETINTGARRSTEADDVWSLAISIAEIEFLSSNHKDYISKNCYERGFKELCYKGLYKRIKNYDDDYHKSQLKKTLCPQNTIINLLEIISNCLHFLPEKRPSMKKLAARFRKLASKCKMHAADDMVGKSELTHHLKSTPENDKIDLNKILINDYFGAGRSFNPIAQGIDASKASLAAKRKVIPDEEQTTKKAVYIPANSKNASHNNDIKNQDFNPLNNIPTDQSQQIIQFNPKKRTLAQRPPFEIIKIVQGVNEKGERHKSHPTPKEISLGNSHPQKLLGEEVPVSQNELENPKSNLVIEDTDIEESLITKFQKNRKTNLSEVSGLEINLPKRKSSESPDAEIWPYNAFIEHFDAPIDGIDLYMSPKTSQNDSSVGLSQQEMDDLEAEFHLSSPSNDATDSKLGSEYVTARFEKQGDATDSKLGSEYGTARFGKQGDTMTTEELNNIQKII